MVNFVCIVFEHGDKMLTLWSMENLIVECNHLDHYLSCLYFKTFLFQNPKLSTNVSTELFSMVSV